MTSNDDNLSHLSLGPLAVGGQLNTNCQADFSLLFIFLFKRLICQLFPVRQHVATRPTAYLCQPFRLALYHQLHGTGPIVSKPSPKLNRSSKMNKIQLAKYVFISQQTEWKRNCTLFKCMANLFCAKFQ